MRLEEISIEERLDLLPVLNAVRHDIGRYICFELRFVEDRSNVAELRRALRSDVLCTRKNGEQVESCLELWLRLRPSRLDGDPDFVIIDTAIHDIMSVDLDGTIQDLHRACALAETIRDASRRLHARGTGMEEQGSIPTTGEDAHG